MTHKRVVKHVGRKRPSSAGYEKRKKMTTEEFVEAVNAIDNIDEIKAYVSARGDVFLRTDYGDRDVDMEIAMLEKHDTSWGVRGISQVTIPTKILKLMVEMAESRAEDNKYVILNGKPFLLEGGLSIRAFLIDKNSLSSCILGIDDLTDFAYTKEELEQMKATLPKNLQEAVDLLTVTVGDAKKVLKYDN
jgi:hypothetical protein